MNRSLKDVIENYLSLQFEECHLNPNHLYNGGEYDYYINNKDLVLFKKHYVADMIYINENIWWDTKTMFSLSSIGMRDACNDWFHKYYNKFEGEYACSQFRDQIINGNVVRSSRNGYEED